MDNLDFSQNLDLFYCSNWFLTVLSQVCLKYVSSKVNPVELNVACEGLRLHPIRFTSYILYGATVCFFLFFFCKDSVALLADFHGFPGIHSSHFGNHYVAMRGPP